MSDDSIQPQMESGSTSTHCNNTISALIARFRNEAPTAPSERNARRKEIAQQFWWLNEDQLQKNVRYSVDSEAQTEDSLDDHLNNSSITSYRDSSYLQHSLSSIPPPPPPLPATSFVPVSASNLPQNYIVNNKPPFHHSMNILAAVDEEFRRLQEETTTTFSDESSDSDTNDSDSDTETPVLNKDLAALDKERQHLLHQSAKLIKKFQRKTMKLQAKHASPLPVPSQSTVQEPLVVATQVQSENLQTSVSSSTGDVATLLKTLRTQNLLSDDSSSDSESDETHRNTHDHSEDEDDDHKCVATNITVNDTAPDTSETNTDKDTEYNAITRDKKSETPPLSEKSLPLHVPPRDTEPIPLKTVALSPDIRQRPNMSNKQNVSFNAEQSTRDESKTHTPHNNRSDSVSVPLHNFDNNSTVNTSGHLNNSVHSSLSSMSLSAVSSPHCHPQQPSVSVRTSQSHSHHPALDALLFVSSSSETGGFASYLRQNNTATPAVDVSVPAPQQTHSVTGSRSVSQMWQEVSPYVSRDTELRQLWEKWLFLKQLRDEKAAEEMQRT